MQKNFVFLLVVLAVFVISHTAAGCKICGNPWCSAEDTHDRIELSIIEPASKRHSWGLHDGLSGWREHKCSHSKSESDCIFHGAGCKSNSKESGEGCKHHSHGGLCKSCHRARKDCCPDCGGHKCHGKDCRGTHSSCPGDKGVRKLECKCKTKPRHVW